MTTLFPIRISPSLIASSRHVFSDVLTFDTAPLESDTEVTGPIQAHMFVSCDCRDFDLWVRLYDVAPDGTAFNLMSPGLDVQRASYRDVTHGRQWLLGTRTNGVWP